MFVHVFICTVLERREAEANAWEKWATLSSLLFVQGHMELQCATV